MNLFAFKFVATATEPRSQASEPIIVAKSFDEAYRTFCKHYHASWTVHSIQLVSELPIIINRDNKEQP